MQRHAFKKIMILVVGKFREWTISIISEKERRERDAGFVLCRNCFLKLPDPLIECKKCICDWTIPRTISGFLY